MKDAMATTMQRTRATQRTLAALMIAAALVAGAARAHADNGVDSELFRPALDSFGIFTVDRAQTSRRLDWGFKLFADYASTPLRLSICPPSGACAASAAMRPPLSAIMSWQTAIHFGFHFGITDWLELVADIPMSAQAYTTAFGDNGSFGSTALERTGFYAAQGFTNTPPPNAAAMDWRVGVKARFLRRGPFALALAAVATLPFGDEAAFLGDSGFTFRPELIADFTRGAITVAVNAGAIIRGETVVRAPNDPAVNGMAAMQRSLLDVGDELTWSAGAAYRFARWAGIAAEVYGFVPLVQAAHGPLDAPRDFTADVAGGFQIFPVKDITLDVGAGAGLVAAAARHDAFRVFVGVSWAPSESRGRTSALPGGLDSDGDGIPDGADLCPNEAEDRDGFDDDDGCPDLDNDADGIPDTRDRCPNEAEDKDGFQDDDGCPDLDNDGDGIPDVQDRCPDEPEDKDGFQDDDGCPDLDNDGDGIPDAIDKCPNEPETRNGVDDEDGCPDSGGAVVIAGGKIELPENLGFDTGRIEVSARSAALLERIAAKIRSNPQVKRIRIEGHTDDIGSAKKNQELSQARAEWVRGFLIRRGVEPERLQAVGYGDTRPLVDHRNAAARAKNRRVDFIIVEQ